MEDEFAPGINPLAIASLVLAVVGMVTYCCGSFVCLGWLGFLAWLLGAVLGVVAVAQSRDGTSKALGGVGLAMNLLFLLALGAVMVLGIGFGLLSEATR